MTAQDEEVQLEKQPPPAAPREEEGRRGRDDRGRRRVASEKGKMPDTGSCCCQWPTRPTCRRPSRQHQGRIYFWTLFLVNFVRHFLAPLLYCAQGRVFRADLGLSFEFLDFFEVLFVSFCNFVRKKSLCFFRGRLL